MGDARTQTEATRTPNNTLSLRGTVRTPQGMLKKERNTTDKPREGWEDGTPPPHRDFKERGVVR